MPPSEGVPVPFVVYVTPFFTETSVPYVAAVAGLPDVRLGLISQDPLERLPAQLQDRLVAHWRVDDTLDAGQIAGAARTLAARHGAIHRLFSAIEQLQVQVAEVREALGIQGMSVDAARNFRDKARMKTILRAAGLPCARHRLVTSDAEALQFAGEVGYPLAVKPPAGAATQATFRVDSLEALPAALAACQAGHEQPVLLEEFITGDEASFDTFSVAGRAVWHSITHYFPTPLEALRTPWIQWVVLSPREVDDARYADIRSAATRALDALGMGSGLSHMEWFRRPDGSIAISEVATRPPGAQFTTLMSRACDFDCVGAWARLMVDDAFDPPARRYATGAAYLRAQGHGERIVAIRGYDQVLHELGDLITDVRLPETGRAPTGHYEGEGYVILRHLETDVVRQALFRVVSLVRVELG
jgi:biotin carboxylase